MGAPIPTRISPGRTRNPPRGSTRWAPSMATGTMGTWASMATTKAPFLNSRILPSRERVPSGNARTLAPAFTRSPASRMLWRALLLSPRSTKIIPVARMYQPRNGTWDSSRLAMKRRLQGSAMKAVGMSIIDWWLQTKRAGVLQSMPSPPSTTSRAPAPPSSPGAHRVRAMVSARSGEPVAAVTPSAALIQKADQPTVKAACPVLNTFHSARRRGDSVGSSASGASPSRSTSGDPEPGVSSCTGVTLAPMPRTARTFPCLDHARRGAPPERRRAGAK